MAGNAARSTTLRRWVLRRWVPYALFAFACILSLAATWYVSSATEAQLRATYQSDQARFLTEAEKTREQIQVRLNTNIELIRAGAALLAASNEISQVEFRTFVAGLQLRERYTGMEAIGFAQRVRHRQLRRFRIAVERDGIRSLRGWHPPPQPEYYPVLFLEPRGEISRTILGHDISTDPTIEEAMKRAADTGQPAASGKLNTASSFDREDEGTFVVLVPVYRIGMLLDTVEDRRRALFGFVFSPFSASKLFQQVVANISPAIVFEVYDGKVASKANLLGDRAHNTHAGAYQSADIVSAVGRPWLVVVRSTEAPVAVGPRPAVGTLFGGLLFSLLLLLITRGQVRAWETSARQEMELRASQASLREREVQAQAADRAKDEFLATLSHELRTPLNAILGWVTMMRSGSVRAERQAHALAVIERNARLQSELIEDLLDISRIVMGKVRLRLRPIAIAPIVTAAVESLRPGAEAKDVQLQAPPPADTLVIRADPERVQQIVWNLVSNAIKFTPPGGRVDVELTRDQSHVHLSVQDTGIGIAPEFLPHVFERFRQADSSTTRPHSGLGLGLAIVRHLAALHGGSIEAFSDGHDRGSRFVIHFPVAAMTSADALAALNAHDVVPSATLDGVRIIVVDDDAGTRELLSEALSTAGAHVVTAESTAQALELLTRDGADMLISDIAMPEEDGLSLIRRVRALSSDIARIPAIALTAFARAEDRTRAIEAGYDMHLAKPVELSELQAAVAELVQANAG
ncbi:MAG TPA: CHASE domain-containing protein [Vicinamibacterales bacterium]|nr:CHASE domain-containing protein [Vicinamibacterales bacterium]